MKQFYGHVSISLIHQFPGMSILKIYMEVILIASQYCLIFLKKYVITITSSVTGKLFSKIVIIFLILKGVWHFL